MTPQGWGEKKQDTISSFWFFSVFPLRPWTSRRRDKPQCLPTKFWHTVPVNTMCAQQCVTQHCTMVSTWNVPHGLRCLNVWFQAGSHVWRDFGNWCREPSLPLTALRVSSSFLLLCSLCSLCSLTFPYVNSSDWSFLSHEPIPFTVNLKPRAKIIRYFSQGLVWSQWWE